MPASFVIAFSCRLSIQPRSRTGAADASPRALAESWRDAHAAQAAGQAAANFQPNMVTFNWTGLDIAPNAVFDISFSSWNNSAFAAVPGPMVGAGLPGLLFGFGGLIVWWRRVRRAYMTPS